MDPSLQRFDHEWKHGDRALAREMAAEWVAAHPALHPILTPRTLEDLVKMMDGYRAAGDEENCIIVDMWLLTNYKPQNITGVLSFGPSAIAEAMVNALVPADAVKAVEQEILWTDPNG
jgi:hypothetical protein